MIKLAAIVCHHVAIDRAPILLAERSEPVEKADSGWHFLCGSSFEDEMLAQVWTVDEVLAREPSLRAFIESPSGTRLSRASVPQRWTMGA